MECTVEQTAEVKTDMNPVSSMGMPKVALMNVFEGLLATLSFNTSYQGFLAPSNHLSLHQIHVDTNSRP